MKKIVLGILAHVDSGKTTLSEGLLFSAGEIRKRGRVDHGDTFLDTDLMEKERGITIFAKQAVLKTQNSLITLLDTPGHIDFSAETERTLSVLDYAILVISGTDGVQSHTLTLWHLLKSHNIPVFVFVNKMDISPYDKNALLHNLKSKLDDNCLIIEDNEEFYENAAMCSEEAMHSFLESGTIKEDTIKELIQNRQMFPCFFGSALKQEGVDSFLQLIDRYSVMPKEENAFGAKIFKITTDEQGNRLTHMKITGGSLSVKEIITGVDREGEEWSEKVNSVRIYSGNKFTVTEKAYQGTVCAVLGLSKTFSGQGLGFENTSSDVTLEPVFSYKIQINDQTDSIVALSKLKKLEEEEPQLKVFWNEQLKEIHLRLMGEIQCEILKRILIERFSLDIDFVEGGIVYKETIKNPVEGVGHFEPLRHYAEVHLLIEPLPLGEGLKFETRCSEDSLSKNWQRLILTHLKERTHTGVLTGAPLTDVKITLVSGKAHLKHTEGGDFRQATYRAVRQGLMQAENVLLEPYYSFILELPSLCLGRAMTDIENMGGTVSPPETDGENAVLTGRAPVSKMRNYHREITVYTKGKGRLSCKLSGYEPCLNQEDVVKASGYDPEADIINTADSVFCSHGAGFAVKWNEVFDYMHLPLLSTEKPKETEIKAFIPQKNKTAISDEELIKIFEMTYGKINTAPRKEMRTEKHIPSSPKYKPKVFDGSYLLVDGYNIIHASEELKKLAEESLEHARHSLISKLMGYQIIKNIEIIVVFDAYKVKGNHGETEKIQNISIVYTKEAETADAYIEKATHRLSKNNRVQVATSDGLEQIIILGQGALRIPASQFLADLENAQTEIEKMVKDYNSHNNSRNTIEFPEES